MMIRTGLPAWATLLLSCGGGITIVDPPPPPPAGPTLLRFVPDSADAAAAEELGWAGSIPDVEVTVTPADSSSPSRLLHGSTGGELDLPDLTAGVLYIIEVSRWLASEERARLPANQDVLGWLVKTKVAAGSGNVTVKVPASRKHGLVISEWAFNRGGADPNYAYGGYLELYNNTDTVVFLDGLILTRGLEHQFDAPTWTCASDVLMTNDPAGIWVLWVNQFPGRGRDFPLEPGGVVTIAIDAIDHSRLAQGGLDLSQADFEFWGAGDVDNPAVPNMVDTLSLGGTVLGHGADFSQPGALVVLARPFHLQSVLRRLGPAGKEYARIPAELIIDVFTSWGPASVPWPRCERLVNTLFDRNSNGVRGMVAVDDEFLHSLSRRFLPSGISGRAYLQWTRDSDADFARTVRSPGTSP